MHPDIKELLALGVRLIPVNEKTKIPLVKWKGVPALSELELADSMTYHGTEAVAMVTGSESGIVCIDIDSKYKSGFHGEFLRELDTLFYDLRLKLRIEKTPSDGRHIYYFLRVPVMPKSSKLASRYATKEELVIDSKEKTKCFLEIKCEGGLAQCAPSSGYIPTQKPENGICELTWDEHCRLHSFCTSFNEVVKLEVAKIEKTFVDIYDENPFVAFDKSVEGQKVLEGWDILKEDTNWIQFSRPNAKTKGVDATFNKNTRLYKIFSTSTELETKSFRPSILLRELLFGGDPKLCYQELVKKGFGKIKQSVEKRYIENAAKFGNALPANVSEEGKIQVNKIREELIGIYPHGIFWEMEEDKYVISRLLVYNVAEKLGFRVSDSGWLVRINGVFIERVEEGVFFDILREYIDLSETYYSDIFNCLDSFLQKNGKFISSSLEKLDKSLILSSSRGISYKGYKNGVLRVEIDEVKLMEWGSVEGLFWKHQVQDRDFIFGEAGGLYYEYLSLCCGISDHLMKCIGYYSHEYKSTSTSYVVVLCEMTENPKNGGGSGKNIFTNLLGFTTSLLNRPGRNVVFDDTLLRTWKNQKIVSLNDVDKKFDYLGLKELASGQGEVGKKYVQEETIENSEMPKFIVNTNYAFDSSGAGLKRRLVPLEFTEFFSSCGGVDVYFGKYFPSDKTSPHDWILDDWIGYDNFIVKCIQKFISAGCKLTIPNLTGGGWTKQFEQKYSQLTLMFIQENIESWLKGEEGLFDGGKRGYVDIVAVFNVQYERFCNENNVMKNFRLSSIKMNEALEDYCGKNGIKFTKTKNRKNASGVQSNVKVFVREDEIEEAVVIEEEKFEMF